MSALLEPSQGPSKTDYILLADHEAGSRDHLKEYLADEGFSVAVCDNAQSVRHLIHARRPDLVLLNAEIPGEVGLALCEALVRLLGIPVILLSDYADVMARISALEKGADDYIIKPFNPGELAARIRTVLRRTRANQIDIGAEGPRFFEFDRWILDAASRTLVRTDNVFHPLSAGEYQLLKIFLERPRTVLGRDALIELTCGGSGEIVNRSIDSKISRFRKLIERNPKAPQIIKTVRRSGYVFTAEVRCL